MKLLDVNDVNSLAISGVGGTMGSTWTLNSLLHEFTVYGHEPDQPSLERAIVFIRKTLEKTQGLAETPDVVMSRLITVDDGDDLISCGAPIHLEVIPENLRLKLEFFRQLGPQLPEDTVLWSNTSCLDVEKMAIASGRPDRFVGTHGMNPVHLTKGVEVVRTDVVDPSVFEWTMAIIKKMGKVPIPAINVPGFIVNRGFMAWGLHYVTMLFDGEFDVATGDAALTLSLNHPQGIFKLLDFIGHKTMVNVGREMEAATGGDSRYKVPEKYQQMVDLGYLGRKTGRGFYDWSDPKNPVPIPVAELTKPPVS